MIETILGFLGSAFKLITDRLDKHDKDIAELKAAQVKNDAQIKPVILPPA